jgi:hypothetical protein
MARILQRMEEDHRSVRQRTEWADNLLEEVRAYCRSMVKKARIRGRSISPIHVHCISCSSGSTGQRIESDICLTSCTSIVQRRMSIVVLDRVNTHVIFGGWSSWFVLRPVHFIHRTSLMFEV